MINAKTSRVHTGGSVRGNRKGVDKDGRSHAGIYELKPRDIAPLCPQGRAISGRIEEGSSYKRARVAIEVAGGASVKVKTEADGRGKSVPAVGVRFEPEEVVTKTEMTISS